MLIELIKSKTDLGSSGLYLRYNLGALLYIEQQNIDFLKMNEILIDGKKARVFLKAGLLDYFEKNNFNEVQRDETVRKIMECYSNIQLFDKIAEAVTTSLPRPNVGGVKKDDSKLDFTQIFTYFCDIMKLPEKLFWDLTLREVMERWDRYAIFNGYKKAPQKFKKYDD